MSELGERVVGGREESRKSGDGEFGEWGKWIDYWLVGAFEGLTYYFEVSLTLASGVVGLVWILEKGFLGAKVGELEG